jgi:hypothetical protein
MSSGVDAICVLPEGLDTRATLRSSIGMLLEDGCVFAPDTLVIFNEVDCHERDSEPADSLAIAEEMLANWPSSGGTQLLYRDQVLFLRLCGLNAHVVDAVSISIGSKHFFRDRGLRASFLGVVRDLHEKLGGLRTIVDVDLLVPGSRWREYVVEAREGSLTKADILNLP